MGKEKLKANNLEPKLAPRSFVKSTDMLHTTVRPYPANLQHFKVSVLYCNVT